MTSLITQLENRINTQQKPQTVNKPKKKLHTQSAVVFGIAVPASGLMGGLIGKDTFEKQKSSLPCVFSLFVYTGL